MQKSFLQLHTAILLGACSGIFGNLISLDALMITWFRMLFAFAILMVIAVASHIKISIARSDYKALAIGFLLALHWTMFYASIKYSNVSVGVVCFCLSGFFTAIISPIVNHRRISLTELALSSLTLAGISLIFHFDSSFRIGILFGIVSALLFALYAVCNERIDKGQGVVRLTMLQMLGGSVGLGVILLIMLLFNSGFEVNPHPVDFLWLLLLAFGCTVGMCTLLNNAQKRISAFTVSLSYNLEPVYSIILAILIFHEEKMLGISFYVGLSLIVVSLCLQMLHVVYKAKRERRSPELD